ncbi:MAG: acyltransferase [Myxococcales bacterium]|jgi:acetyltransferase-like isoleucine patch superfamily enzyme
MQKAHIPLALERARQRFEQRYAEHFLVPHFDAVGEGCTFADPWAITVYGPSIRLGRRVHLTGMRQSPLRLAFTPAVFGEGGIEIGDFSIINPGVSINAACHVTIGKNAIFAPEVYVTDCDWHGAYDRVYDTGGRAPVVLEDNVWVGARVIITKGVTVGKNSIVGAGAVVTHDVPPHSVVAGNPARVVRELDPDERYVSRGHVFDDAEGYYEGIRRLEDAFLSGNTFREYVRYLLFPRRGD